MQNTYGKIAKCSAVKVMSAHESAWALLARTERSELYFLVRVQIPL